MTMSRDITSTTAADGTELRLQQRDDGLYEIRDSSGEIIEEPSATDEAGARGALERTESNINVGIEAEQTRQSRPSSMGGFTSSPGVDEGTGFGGGGGGGLFGAADPDSERATSSHDRDDGGSGGGLFGGGGGLFGSGSSARRERDQNSGRFTSTRREPADFEMERGDDGQFTGRASDDERDSGGLFGGLFR